MGHPRSNWSVPTVLRSAHCRHTLQKKIPVYTSFSQQCPRWYNFWRMQVHSSSICDILCFRSVIFCVFQTLVLNLHIFQFLKSSMEDQNHFQQEIKSRSTASARLFGTQTPWTDNRSNGSTVRALTDGQTDGRTLPSTLSPSLRGR